MLFSDFELRLMQTVVLSVEKITVIFKIKYIKIFFTNYFEKLMFVLLIRIFYFHRLTLQLMKRKQLLYSFTLAAAVLFSILFQSFHSYEHLEKQLSHKFCVHNPTQNKAELTHQHKVFEQCAVCHFEFGSSLCPKFISYHFFSDFRAIPFFSKDQKEIISFSGSLYAHRGPPAFV